MTVRRPSSLRLQRLAGVGLLFLVSSWAVFIQLPSMKEGYFDAGDDHIHVAYTNELVRIWHGEGRLLGWSRLYGTGFPIFLLRPPGLYFASALTHLVTGVSVEESLKLVVILGFALFPFSVFAGARMLGLGFWPSVLAGSFAPLPISLWGHTLDAYHYLGVHKQLLAILLFPPTVGALWRLLREGRCGLLFALLFTTMLFTHPYIAYCMALLPALMLVALAAAEPGWDWRRRVPHALLWAAPTVLMSLLWILPFYSSPEIQSIDPFLGVRSSFDVVVSTSAETLRQFFLGGILDTTRYAGTFGGSHEWGWLDNSAHFRFPILTLLATIGWGVVLIRPRASAHAFMALAFLLSLLLLIGPDDFPFLDAIPFSSQFQNIHAIFIFEWAAMTLAGVGACSLFRLALRPRARAWKVVVVGLVTAAVGAGWFSAARERTFAAERLSKVRSQYTRNGELVLRPTLERTWVQLKHVVDRMNESPRAGSIGVRGSSFLETVLYNLLPLMTDRAVFTSGFQKVGGVYPLLRGMRKDDVRTNADLQRLFNVRFIVTYADDDQAPKEWPETTRLVHENRFWQLREVQGDFGALDPLPRELIGFVGSEREWAAMMKKWLPAYRKAGPALPWIVNFEHSGLAPEDLARLRPYLRAVISIKAEEVPAAFADLETLHYDNPEAFDPIQLMRKLAKDRPRRETAAIAQEVLESSRAQESFRVRGAAEEVPLLFKRAFYRGWEARIDGRETTVFRVSPGMQMILLPPGEHELSWAYQGPNRWAWAKGAFCLGLLLALALRWGERVLPALRAASPVPASPRPPPSRRPLALVPRAAWCVLIGVLLYQTWSEAVLRRPVPIRPPGGRYAVEPYKDSRLDVFWNYVVGIPTEEQTFTVEIARRPDFQEVVASQQVSRNKARFKRKEFEPGQYFYRVRLEADGQSYAWTRPIQFEVLN